MKLAQGRDDDARSIARWKLRRTFYLGVQDVPGTSVEAVANVSDAVHAPSSDRWSQVECIGRGK